MTTDRGHRTVLNHDILIHTMLFLPQNDHLSLMRTCQALYQDGMPRYIEQHFSHLTDQDALPSQLDFLLADPARIRCLKSLDLTMVHLDEQIGKKVSQILNRATNNIAALKLRHLKVEGSAISSLRKLRRLVIIGAALTLGFLKDMQSPISSLSFGLDNGRLGGPEMSVDPINLIANFKDTLAELIITRTNFQRDDIQFLGVHTLQLQYSSEPNVVTLQHCFPNLRKFTLVWTVYFPVDDQSVEIARQRNLLRAQEPWTSLDTLIAGVDYLYLLGPRIQKPVQTWRVDSVCARPHVIERFHTLLRDLRPRRLSTGQIYGMEREDFIDILNDIFPKSSVTHLSFTLFLTFLPVGVEPAAVTNVFLLWASKLELTSLQVRIECHENPTMVLQAREETPTPANFGAYLRTWDLQSYVRQLADVSPNLQYVFFTFSLTGNNPPPPSFWEIVKDESNVQPRSLTVEEAKAAIRSASVDWVGPPCLEEAGEAIF